ncbi:hypothetical protein GN956_G5571 [Arapaima gigas]
MLKTRKAPGGEYGAVGSDGQEPGGGSQAWGKGEEDRRAPGQIVSRVGLISRKTTGFWDRRKSNSGAP